MKQCSPDNVYYVNLPTISCDSASNRVEGGCFAHTPDPARSHTHGRAAKLYTLSLSLYE